MEENRENSASGGLPVAGAASAPVPDLNHPSFQFQCVQIADKTTENPWR